MHTISLKQFAPRAMLVALGALLALGAGVASLARAQTVSPVISDVTATSTDTTATITWATDVPSDSQVAYGETLPYSATSTLADSASPVTVHSVTLTGLAPDTMYHFEALSSASSTATAASSTPTMSADATFTTASTATGPATLALSATAGAPGDTITASGSNFAASEPITLDFGGSTSATNADTNGNFSATLTVPSLPGGSVDVTATGGQSGSAATVAFSVSGSGTTPSGPTVSQISAAPTDTTATITWATDLPATSQVAYGTTTNYSTFSVLDTGLVTDHFMTLTDLVPDTTYHFIVLSMDASNNATSSADQIFTTNAASTTGTGTTGTTTDISTLQNEVTTLQQQVAALQQQVQMLLQGQSTGAGGGTLPTGTASIDQNGQTVRAGGSTDFGGHNFGPEEHVSVMLNGAQVGQAFTNRAGGFSTGSMSVPATPGTYTYTFVGQNSGITATATITTQ